MSKLIYLCGPITELSYGGATDWRKAIEKLLIPGIEVLSPLRGKDFLAKEAKVADCYAEMPMATQRAITTRDRFDTMRADMIIANLLGAERVSIGSMIELGWADAQRIPIIGIMEPTNLHDHSMVREILNWRVGSIEDAAGIANLVFQTGN